MQPPPPPYYAASKPIPQHMNMNAPPAYGSPHSHQMGSLGTPRVGWAPGSLGDGRWRPYQPQQQPQQNIILVPTRPLLKALAKECKPCPPWCVGHPIPESLTSELGLFARFLDRTPQEAERHSLIQNTIQTAFRAVWPSSSLSHAGINAAGVFPPESTVHLYAESTTDSEEARTALRTAANENGFQISFFEDYRGCQTALLTEARTGDKAAVRFGAQVERTKASAEIIRQALGRNEASRVVLIALDALLRQNKVLDESGSSPGIPAEAIAIMIICIANSYDESDTPTAERLLTDFFLTFGFPAHFDSATLSIDYKGMTNQVPKVHLNSQLSVLDPADPKENLTGRVDKVPHILAVFNYCYTAVSQFSQTAPTARRAQSALSTVIGGETYWSRVLHLYHQQVEPFYSVVLERQASLAQYR